MKYDVWWKFKNQTWIIIHFHRNELMFFNVIFNGGHWYDLKWFTLLSQWSNVFFTIFLVNEAFSIAITAIIMAGLIGLGILLRYLLRRYRNYILRRGRRDTITAAPREDHSYRRTLAAAQEVEAATLATIKKEPVTPHSCHCTLAAAQELRHAIKMEPVSPRSCRRTLSMPVISPRKDPYLRDELIAL